MPAERDPDQPLVPAPAPPPAAGQQEVIGLLAAAGVGVTVGFAFGPWPGGTAGAITAFWLALVGPPAEGPRADRAVALIAAATVAALALLLALALAPRAAPFAGAAYAWTVGGLVTARLGGRVPAAANRPLPWGWITAVVVSGQIGGYAFLFVLGPHAFLTGLIAALWVQGAILVVWLHVGLGWALVGGRVRLGAWCSGGLFVGTLFGWGYGVLGSI